MPRLTDAFALIGISVVLGALMLSFLVSLSASWRTNGLQPTARHMIAVGCLAMLWIPVGDAQIPTVAYIRGITSDPSVSLIALAALQVGRLAFGIRTASSKNHTAVMAALAVTAVFLYPLALGWGDWDAYQPGWGSWGMLLMLLVVCSACLAKRLRLLPALIALSLLAWSTGLMESGNLWDYLIDPWLSVCALSFVFLKYVKRFYHRLGWAK